MSEILDEISEIVCEDAREQTVETPEANPLDTKGVCFGLVISFNEDAGKCEQYRKAVKQIRRIMTTLLGISVGEYIETASLNKFSENNGIIHHMFNDHVFRTSINYMIPCYEYMPNPYSVYVLLNYIEEIREHGIPGYYIRGAFALKPGKSWDDCTGYQAIWPMKENERQWMPESFKKTYQLSVIYRVTKLMTGRYDIIIQFKTRLGMNEEFIMSHMFTNYYIDTHFFKEENTKSYPPVHTIRIMHGYEKYRLNKKYLEKVIKFGKEPPVVLWNMEDKTPWNDVSDLVNDTTIDYIKKHAEDFEIGGIFYIRSNSNPERSSSQQMNVLTICIYLKTFYLLKDNSHYMFGIIHKCTAEDFDNDMMSILNPEINLIKDIKYWQLPLLEDKK